MADIHFHDKYLKSDRGVCKLLQIILGFVITAILCANWYGGSSCFGEGRIGYTSGLNFVALVGNIIFFLLNVMNIRLYKLEQFYNVVMTVLFFIAIVLMIWYLISLWTWNIWLIIVLVSVIFIFIFFQWDFKSNRSLGDEHLPI